MSLFDKKTSVSPVSIGGKIKKYRTIRGWSQRELGIKCGFSLSTADVRIQQYESCKKIPRKEVLKSIADALQVDVCTFFNADIFSISTMYHVLFDMEDFFGLHPVKIGENYYLEFSGETVLHQYISKQVFQDFFSDWYEERKKYQPYVSDTDEEKERKAMEYALLHGQYPFRLDIEIYERMRDRIRMAQLQEEMDTLKEKMKQYDTT